MVYRLIAPDWLLLKDPTTPKTVEGRLTFNEIQKYNKLGYNCYTFPNYPANYASGSVKGSMVDTFGWIFIDMDLKEGKWASKDDFYLALDIPPTKIIDSGNGVHAYWKVTDLDAMSFLRLSRRLMRKYNTDPAVSKLAQLMRVPDTLNTKIEGHSVLCSEVYSEDISYTCEELDKLLPTILHDDEEYCKFHYNTTHNVPSELKIPDKLPPKFGKLLESNKEVKEIWASDLDDRSKGAYRLGNIMRAYNFTELEAMAVLMNSAKALTRSDVHRYSYAENIVKKIWTIEEQDAELTLSSSVADLLSKPNNGEKGQRFYCHPRIDNTAHGFRLGQVLGLIAGSGVGKTAFALNTFQWFVQNNPDYVHFFIPLEQPAHEIAERWETMCQGNKHLHDKVHIMSNYDDKGGFRHLSFDEIKDYINKFKRVTGKKVGCVVIDHIGVLKQEAAHRDKQPVEATCHKMKAFAVETNTFLIMQSQTSREKAGIGDVELDKDAAYGTVFFESYCDYVVTLWQPLKRCHDNPDCPTITAYKFCKIRHKKAKQDIIKEDKRYYAFFDSDVEQLRDLTQTEKTQFDWYAKQAKQKRNSDKKVEIGTYESVPWSDEDAGLSNNKQDRADTGSHRVSH